MADNMKAAASSTQRGACEVDALNSLLRGEISATETYEQALGKFDGPDRDGMTSTLTRIRDEHKQAAEVLRNRVRQYGGTPSDGAGAWGVFANAVTGAAKVIGPQTVLAALKQGEQHGIAEYEKACQNPDVPLDCTTIFRNDLLPRSRQHLSTLDSMIGQLEAKDGK